jgi:hypothetical protein
VGALAAVGAQGALPPPQTQPGAGLVPPGKDPYAKVFQVPQDDKARQDLRGANRSPSAVEMQPRVVCGMVVVPVKPSADPKMVVQPGPNPKTEYSIRKIAPQICNE